MKRCRDTVDVTSIAECVAHDRIVVAAAHRLCSSTVLSIEAAHTITLLEALS